MNDISEKHTWDNYKNLISKCSNLENVVNEIEDKNIE